MSSYVLPLFPAAAASPLPTRDAVAAELERLRGYLDAAFPLKADKAPPSAAGNLASLDASGNLSDSGATPASIKAAAVAEVVANAPGTMDTLKEIADILGSSQQAGTVLKRILDLESGKVDKVQGRGLSENDYTDADKEKLAGVAAGATAVSVDATLAVQGAAADAKAVGDAFRKGFTEWTVVPSVGPTGLPVELVYEEETGKWSLCEREDVEGGEPVHWPFAEPKGDEDSTHLEWSADDSPDDAIVGEAGFEASRALVTPTKTSQLANDSGFVKTADLPYALVTLTAGSGAWTVSGLGEGWFYGEPAFSSGTWLVGITSPTYFGEATASGDAGDLSVSFSGEIDGEPFSCTFSRPYANGASLLDRVVNRVSVTGATTLTLPSLVTGKSRDFYLKMTVTGSQSVSFSPSSGVVYTGSGNPTKTYSAGTYLLRFTETSENEFCVTDMLAEYADASALPYALVSKTPVSGSVSLSDRAVNLVSPTVTATTEWTWADGETGTPIFSNGYWTVQNASFDTYDGPVAGSATDTEITFAKTDTKSFYYSTTDYDYETGDTVFVFNVGGEGGEDVRAKCKWSDEHSENIVESVDYGGVKYVFEYPVTEYSTGNTYSGTGTVAEHVASLVTTYGPVVTLTMPQAVPGRVRDLIARIDLSQAAGAPPVAFSGGSFEAVDGEMPELVKGVNLLSFTETASGVFAVAYKEVKPIAQGGS